MTPRNVMQVYSTEFRRNQPPSVVDSTCGQMDRYETNRCFQIFKHIIKMLHLEECSCWT